MILAERRRCNGFQLSWLDTRVSSFTAILQLTYTQIVHKSCRHIFAVLQDYYFPGANRVGTEAFEMGEASMPLTKLCSPFLHALKVWVWGCDRNHLSMCRPCRLAKAHQHKHVKHSTEYLPFCYPCMHKASDYPCCMQPAVWLPCQPAPPPNLPTPLNSLCKMDLLCTCYIVVVCLM